MTMRLGFAIAAFLEADVLLLDEVFAVGDESFQRKCFGVISAFKERGGTILFVSHDASAVERLCDRAVLLRRRRGSRSTGRCTRRSRATGAPGRGRRGGRDERQRTGGHGGGAHRRRAARGRGRGGARPVRRRRAVRPRDRSRGAAAARRRSISRCATARGCSSPRRSSRRRALGGRTAAGGLELRLDVPAPPLQFGRFDVTLALLGADGRLLDRLPRGSAARLSGRGEPRARAPRRNVAGGREGCLPMSYKTCPDWPTLMELAPDLQFKHMTVHEAQLPFEVVAKIPSGSPSTSSSSAATWSTTSSMPPTRIPTWSRRSRGRTGSRCTSGPRPARARTPAPAAPRRTPPDRGAGLASAHRDHADPSLRTCLPRSRCTRGHSASRSSVAPRTRGTSRSRAATTA